MSRLIELARAGNNEVVSAPEAYRDVSEANIVRNFIAWMRKHDGDGWWAACEIDKLFAQFCTEERWPLLNFNIARQLMMNVPGVYRKKHRLKGVFSDIARATGLERATLYWIPPAETIRGPWPDQDRSYAAPEPAQDHPETTPGPAPCRSRTGTQELCEGSIR